MPYVWSPKIRQPPRPPQLVYLDLNHWIALSKCMAGHADGRQHTEVLDACLSAAHSGQSVFPIADAIYIEITNIRQYEQRKKLREVIERVSNYLVVMPRVVTTTLEIDAMLDTLIGPSCIQMNDVSYLDWGVARAFGMTGGFRVFDDSDNDVTDEVAETYLLGRDIFTGMLSEAELHLNRRVLDGPSAAEESEMTSLGWSPKPTLELMKYNAGEEIEQVKRFDADSRWRRGRIRDVIATRELGLEINDILSEAIQNRGVESLEHVFSTPSSARAAFDAVPSFDVSVSLKTAYHRDANHLWIYNDLYDISAMASTLPYCDVVVTDKEVASHIERSGLSERLNTRVLSSIADLPEFL